MKIYSSGRNISSLWKAPCLFSLALLFPRAITQLSMSLVSDIIIDDTWPVWTTTANLSVIVINPALYNWNYSSAPTVGNLITSLPNWPIKYISVHEAISGFSKIFSDFFKCTQQTNKQINLIVKCSSFPRGTEFKMGAVQRWTQTGCVTSAENDSVSQGTAVSDLLSCALHSVKSLLWFPPFNISLN